MIFHLLPFPIMIVFSMSTLFAVKTTAFDEAYEDSVHHPGEAKMLRSLKGTKDFAHVHDPQTSQKVSFLGEDNNLIMIIVVLSATSPFYQLLFSLLFISYILLLLL